MSGPIQWTHAHGFIPAITTTAAGPIAPDAASLDEGDDDVEDKVLSPLKRAAEAAARSLSKNRVSAAPVVSPTGIVAAARKRLREIDVELRRMKRLEVERDELRRLVDAAKNKPCAVVHGLPKRSAG